MKDLKKVLNEINQKYPYAIFMDGLMFSRHETSTEAEKAKAFLSLENPKREISMRRLKVWATASTPTSTTQ